MKEQEDRRQDGEKELDDHPVVFEQSPWRTYILTAFFAGGSRYFYCPVMKVAMTTSCCSGERVADEPGAEPRDALVAPDCCQARSVATVPPTPIASPQEELVSPLAVTLPAVAIVAIQPAARQVARFTHPVRAGPTTPSARRAQLMIWTC